MLTIVQQHAEPAVIDTALTVAMTADEARDITDKINATAASFAMLLLEAYEGRAWNALGYATWGDYCRAEFTFSKSYIYRRLDQARVIRALAGALPQSPIGDSVNEHQARILKPVLPAAVDEIGRRVSDGQPVADAVDDVVHDLQQRARRYGRSREKSDFSNRIVANTVVELTAVTADFDQRRINFENLDSELVPSWAAEMRQAAHAILTFADELEAKAGRR